MTSQYKPTPTPQNSVGIKYSNILNKIFNNDYDFSDYARAASIYWPGNRIGHGREDIVKFWKLLKDALGNIKFSVEHIGYLEEHNKNYKASIRWFLEGVHSNDTSEFGEATNKNIFVEAESANIGKCKIPHEFFNQMKHSRRIEILRSESNRLDELIDTYSVFKKEELQESVLRIKKRLGPQRTKIAIESINNEKWDLVCRSVLDYYDKCYEFEKVGKKNIRILDLTDKKYDDRILELINNVL